MVNNVIMLAAPGLQYGRLPQAALNSLAAQLDAHRRVQHLQGPVEKQ
jgi:hypothetical protein